MSVWGHCTPCCLGRMQVEQYKIRLKELSGGAVKAVGTFDTRIEDTLEQVRKDLVKQLEANETKIREKNGRTLVGVPSWETQRPLVDMVLEKLLAAMSSVFLGTLDSDFSVHINELRKALKVHHMKDSFLCDKL